MNRISPSRVLAPAPMDHLSDDPKRSKPACIGVMRVIMACGLRACAIAWLAFATQTAPLAHVELIDRVLAVVEGQIVTLSDVRAALQFGLVPADISADPVQAALRRLVDRRLMLVEVERYAPPEPPESAVDAGLAAVRARFSDARAFDEALKQSPMSPDVLRRYVRDSLRIEIYLQQRFSSTAQPSDDEILKYYNEQPSAFTVNGTLRPLSAVREEVIARIAEERQAQAIREWLAGLWRRGSIVMLPSVTRS